MTNVFLWLFCNMIPGDDIATINDDTVPNSYGGSNGSGDCFINGVYSKEEAKVQCFEK